MQASNEESFNFESGKLEGQEEEQYTSSLDRETSVPNSVNSVAHFTAKPLTSDKHSQPEVGVRNGSVLNWLNFLATATISVALLLLNWQQYRNAEARQKYDMVSNYLAQMMQLRIGRDYINLPEDKAQDIASAATLNTLRQLNGENFDGAKGQILKFMSGGESDGETKGQLLKFLYGADLIGGQCQTNFETLDISSCETKAVVALEDAKLDKTAFKPPMPQLPGIVLSGASLIEADLSGVDLTKAKMAGVNLNNAVLTGIRLRQAEINQATLERTNLAGAILIEADLSGSNLQRAILSGANLHKTILKGADLRNADLRNADLRNADLEGVIFDGAVYNKETSFPIGFNQDAQGMTLCTTPVEKECEALK